MVRGNLLEEPVDAIVNAANGHLAHGGGVAGVISRAAGPELQLESDRLVAERGPYPTGSAVVTTAGKLPFKGVIHAVGPRLGEGDEETKLRQGADLGIPAGARARLAERLVSRRFGRHLRRAARRLRARLSEGGTDRGPA